VNNCRLRVFMNFVVDCTIDYNFDMACTASVSSNARCDQASDRQVGTGCQHLCCEICISAVQEQRRLEALRRRQATPRGFEASQDRQANHDCGPGYISM
jgi:hypothetical protein